LRGPLRVIAALVGVAPNYQREFKGLADSILATYTPTINADRVLAHKGLQIVREVIESRRDNPTDDFISVLIHQKMFESRLFFVDKLIDMGAKIILCDPHRASVIGHDFQSQLKSTTMTSPDIRAGISLLIAALSAKGTSTIHNIEQIDRGYQNIDTRLRAIGAKIERVN
jgi:hypothetical protein